MIKLICDLILAPDQLFNQSLKIIIIIIFFKLIWVDSWNWISLSGFFLAIQKFLHQNNIKTDLCTVIDASNNFTKKKLSYW